MSGGSLDFFFYPRSLAVIGASSNPASFGCDFMHHITSYGYKGNIYPINPKGGEIFGLKAYPDILDVPGTVDFVICCIAIPNVPALLPKCAQKGVKGLHILAGRGSETGRADARELEVDLAKKAKEYGIRLIGPNCLGVHCPETGLAFGYDFPTEPGVVGGVIQSGGNSTDLVHIGSLRGLRFSKIVSYGNAIDINQNDLFEYFLNDPKTKVVVSYIEGLKGDSREFLRLVRETTKIKPVIICKGGRTSAGSRLTASHTASLAGSGQIWEAAVKQAGAIPVKSLDELINMAVAFSMLPPITGKRVAIAGAGGGRGILTVDAWAEEGFEIPPLPGEIIEEFKRRGSQIWDWIGNPADTSITIQGDAFSMPDIAAEMAKSSAFDFIGADAEEDPPFNKDHFMQELVGNNEGFIKVKKEGKKPILVVFDERSVGSTEADSWNYQTRAQMRTRLVQEKVAFFPSTQEAAKAVKEVIGYYERRRED
jgi:acetate---CoA ligase (ADP-forming)